MKRSESLKSNTLRPSYEYRNERDIFYMNNLNHKYELD